MLGNIPALIIEGLNVIVESRSLQKYTFNEMNYMKIDFFSLLAPGLEPAILRSSIRA